MGYQDFPNFDIISQVKVEELMDISTQDLVGQYRQRDEGNNRFCSPMSYEEVSKLNKKRIPQGTRKQNS